MIANTTNFEQMSVIILAAGMSSRMGVPKPFLKWDKHKTFLEKILDTYYSFSFEAAQIILELNPEGYKFIQTELPEIVEYAEIIINKNPERGRFSSLKLGLQNLIKTSSCYIQNADNPFVTEGLLASMKERIKPDSYVVPTYQGKGGHPILIGTEIIKSLLLLDDADIDLKEPLKTFKKVEVETTDMNILVNINSQEDYHNYFKHII
jgi:molybdenum cofactor cytidylyltransferase